MKKFTNDSSTQIILKFTKWVTYAMRAMFKYDLLIWVEISVGECLRLCVVLWFIEVHADQIQNSYDNFEIRLYNFSLNPINIRENSRMNCWISIWRICFFFLNQIYIMYYHDTISISVLLKIGPKPESLLDVPLPIFRVTLINHSSE